MRARLCTYPSEFPWTSYRATAGLEPAPRFLTVDALLSLFSADRETARERYRAFVTEGIAASDPLSEPRGAVLRSDEFVRRATGGTMLSREIPRVSRDPLPPSLERLLAEGERGVVAAYREHGYTLAAIAEHLGCHYSTGSRRLRVLEDGRDPPPRRRRRRA